jgi:hypothetical protein
MIFGRTLYGLISLPRQVTRQYTALKLSHTKPYVHIYLVIQSTQARAQKAEYACSSFRDDGPSQPAKVPDHLQLLVCLLSTDATLSDRPLSSRSPRRPRAQRSPTQTSTSTSSGTRRRRRGRSRGQTSSPQSRSPASTGPARTASRPARARTRTTTATAARTRRACSSGS